MPILHHFIHNIPMINMSCGSQ